MVSTVESELKASWEAGADGTLGSKLVECTEGIADAALRRFGKRAVFEEVVELK
jgi:hypothetical protein